MHSHTHPRGLILYCSFFNLKLWEFIFCIISQQLFKLIHYYNWNSISFFTNDYVSCPKPRYVLWTSWLFGVVEAEVDVIILLQFVDQRVWPIWKPIIQGYNKLLYDRIIITIAARVWEPQGVVWYITHLAITQHHQHFRGASIDNIAYSCCCSVMPSPTPLLGLLLLSGLVVLSQQKVNVSCEENPSLFRYFIAQNGATHPGTLEDAGAKFES